MQNLTAMNTVQVQFELELNAMKANVSILWHAIFSDIRNVCV